jgi:tRNA 2-thiouridine synthesizing protein A
LPVLRARKALRDVAPGGLLTVLATDPAAPRDFRAFCEQTGHRLESCLDEAGVYTITLRHKG